MYRREEEKNKSTLDVQYKWTKDGVIIIGKLGPRLCKSQCAELMGLKGNDLCGLQKYGLLYPSGHNPKKGRVPFNSCWYCTREVLEKMEDPVWWDEAQHAISQYNKEAKLGKAKEG